MRTTLALFVLAVVAPAALALPADSERTYVLSGQVFVYPADKSDLGDELRFAPAGARSERDHVLKIETPAAIVLEGESVVRLDSGAIAPESAGLVATAGADLAIDMGVPELHVDGGGWVLYGTSEGMAARPILAIAPESLSVRVLSEIELSISGELVLHEALAEELGLAHLAGRPAGSIALVARTYRGAGRTLPIQSVRGPSSTGAQPTPSQMNLVGGGPDVIVSTIGSALTKNGTVGTISAYSMTTVSCNLSTTNAIWIDCTTGGPTCNQHPVIGQQIYRLKTVNGAKQFEQIGMSWLKHGFCGADAQNQATCPGPYVSDGTCDSLGQFATDTYDSGLNGSQPRLGPRSEVNAWTGVYPYPYVLNWNATGNAIYKRTQVQNADLLPASNVGAQYFAEVQYICTDEIDANRYNNVSWRAVTSGGADGTTLGFSGSTVQQQPAIRAWAANDAGVLLTDVDIPGDGRFVLGSKATNVGGNVWHYEYVLYNMNAHTGAYLLSIPAASIVNPRNTGFHDVPYHSGELIDGTDWPAAVTASSVTWNTSTFAVNPNANALRWSTAYSFRFDADAPPVNGLATIGLFRIGGSVTGAVVVPGEPGGPYCFGDGTGLACPCANVGSPGNGCANSVIPAGANLSVAGFASIGVDSLTLVAAGMPNGFALFYQGTTATSGGQGEAFGDGLRCAGGAVRRFKTQSVVGFASQYPGIGDAPIHVAGAITGPATHTYQCWYRNANATFCTPDLFNLSNGFRVTWAP